ncbi:hypothetical protein [Delftia sp. PE138]|uniref:hypothetical protein n=1 Tax=Delftia sp. PE138 TaxID=1812483 RepID=UPI001BAF1151|nr:hypothetical protein [Delftia sp. PE138]MBS3721839.1 hypothetical protein [Delftia sp. PE138]
MSLPRLVGDVCSLDAIDLLNFELRNKMCLRVGKKGNAMASYLVTYDLIKQKNYDPLIKALESFNYWHCLKSTWIIKSDGPAAAIRDALAPYIDADDKLVVVLLAREAAWTLSLPQECQDWLQNNL